MKSIKEAIRDRMVIEAAVLLHNSLCIIENAAETGIKKGDRLLTKLIHGQEEEVRWVFIKRTSNYPKKGK